MTQVEQLIASLEWLQTLSDSTRVRLMRLLESNELSVSELCTVVQLPQSTVSRHLRVLAEDHWVMSRREGTTNMYRVDVQDWSDSRVDLWSWVRGQIEVPSVELDSQRLAAILRERSRSEAFFRSSAEQWDSLRVELFGQKLDAFIFAASLKEDAVVGELGCGSAPLSQIVAPFVRKVVAIDNSKAMLRAAKERLEAFPNVQLQQNQLNELELQDDYFDAAWLTVVLPFLPTPGDVFREIGRVLKPDAALVIVDLLPHDREAYRQEMGHLRLGIQHEELKSWVELGGLEIKRYSTLPPDPKAKGPALFAAVAKRSV